MENGADYQIVFDESKYDQQVGWIRDHTQYQDRQVDLFLLEGYY